ncbi:MAG TPA: hypothetical protein VM659_23245 [Dongiaceae bacterium]|nr:hypothetical protein [Dongiaceae bacterium]
MISLAETNYACRGLLRVLRFDSGFVQFFDRSREGALRSFWIYVPLLLLDWAQIVLLHDPQAPTLTGRMWAALIIAHIINVFYFPLILLSVGRYIDRANRVIGCITVYNWLNLLTITLGIPMTLLGWAGADDNVILIIQVVNIGLVLVCEGYILAVCLQISGFFAIGFVALDFVIGEMLFSVAHLLGRHSLF